MNVLDILGGIFIFLQRQSEAIPLNDIEKLSL